MSGVSLAQPPGSRSSPTDPRLANSVSEFLHRQVAGGQNNGADASLDSHRARNQKAGPLAAAFAAFHYNPTDVEYGVIATQSFRRLDQLMQMSYGYTSGSKDLDGLRERFKHTRGAHSVGVQRVAAFLAEQNKLPQPIAIAFRLAALLHDIGHVPFSHSGEEILRRDNSFNNHDASRFCHDKFGCDRILKSDIGDVIREIGAPFGVTPEMVVAILEDNDGLGFAIKEIADRFDYITRDLCETKFVTSVRNQIRDVSEFCLGAKIDLIPGSDQTVFKPAAYRVSFDQNLAQGNVDRPEERDTPQFKIMSLRQILFQEYSLHPRALLVNAVLNLATKEALAAGRFKGFDFRLLTDREAIERFLPPVAKWFEPDSSTMIDERYVSVGSCSLDEVYDAKEVASADFAEKIKGELLNEFESAGLTQWDLFFCATPLEQKKVSFDISFGQNRLVTDSRVFEPELKYCRAFLAVSKDLDPELREKITSSFTLRMHDRPGLLSGKKLTKNNILEQPIDLTLFLEVSGHGKNEPPPNIGPNNRNLAAKGTRVLKR